MSTLRRIASEPETRMAPPWRVRLSFGSARLTQMFAPMDLTLLTLPVFS